MSELIAILQRLPGLTDADPHALADLAAHMKRRSYKDEVICKEGEQADRLWVLASGSAEVLKRSETGREFVVATLSPVCLFGHVGLFTSGGRTATVRAAGLAEVLQMSSTQAHLVLRSSSQIVGGPFRRALIVALSQQLTAATQTLWRLADELGTTEALPPEEVERKLSSANSKV